MWIGDHEFWEQMVQKRMTEVRKQASISEL